MARVFFPRSCWSATCRCGSCPAQAADRASLLVAATSTTAAAVYVATFPPSDLKTRGMLCVLSVSLSTRGVPPTDQYQNNTICPPFPPACPRIVLSRVSLLSQSAKVAAKGPVKKKRAKKDKNAPKGAMSAFMQFSQKERPLVSLKKYDDEIEAK